MRYMKAMGRDADRMGIGVDGCHALPDDMSSETRPMIRVRCGRLPRTVVLVACICLSVAFGATGWMLVDDSGFPVDRTREIMTVWRHDPARTWYWLQRCAETGFGDVTVVERTPGPDDPDDGWALNGGFSDGELERHGWSRGWNPLRFYVQFVTAKDGTVVRNRVIASCSTLGSVDTGDDS